MSISTQKKRRLRLKTLLFRIDLQLGDAPDFDSPSVISELEKTMSALALPMGIGMPRTGASVVFSCEPSDLH
jgi:hypothetical protein